MPLKCLALFFQLEKNSFQQRRDSSFPPLAANHNLDGHVETSSTKEHSSVQFCKPEVVRDAESCALWHTPVIRMAIKDTAGDSSIDSIHDSKSKAAQDYQRLTAIQFRMSSVCSRCTFRATRVDISGVCVQLVARSGRTSFPVCDSRVEAKQPWHWRVQEMQLHLRLSCKRTAPAARVRFEFCSD